MHLNSLKKYKLGRGGVLTPKIDSMRSRNRKAECCSVPPGSCSAPQNQGRICTFVSGLILQY